MSSTPDSGNDPGRRRPGSGRIVPSWIVVPLAGAAGFLTASWPGLAFGLLLGAFLWRLRS